MKFKKIISGILIAVSILATGVVSFAAKPPVCVKCTETIICDEKDKIISISHKEGLVPEGVEGKSLDWLLSEATPYETTIQSTEKIKYGKDRYIKTQNVTHWFSSSSLSEETLEKLKNF